MAGIDIVVELVAAGRYREAAASWDSSVPPGPGAAVMRASLELHVGSPKKALTKAEALLRERLAPSERVACLQTIGKAQVVLGNTDEGCRILREAVRAARDDADLVAAARAQALLTTTLLQWVGIEAGLTEMATLRHAAYVAGDAHALCEFHCAAAEIEMKRRRGSASARHLRSAQPWSVELNNDFLSARLYTLTANAALIESSPVEAQANIELSLRHAERSGSSLALVPALSTSAHVWLMRGGLDEAERALERMLAFPIAEKARLAAFDSLMQIALHRGDDAAAERLVQAIRSVAQSPYYALWHTATKARWLLLRGEIEEALDLIASEIDSAEHTGDTNLHDTLQFLRAEALALRGEYLAATEVLRVTSAKIPEPTVEHIAAMCRISAIIAAPTDCGLSRSLSNRADRILDDGGFIDLRHKFSVAIPANASLSSRTDTAPGPAGVLQATSALIQLIAQPKSAAREALDILTQCGALESAVVRSVGPTDGHHVTEQRCSTSPSPTTAGDVVCLRFGGENAGMYELVLKPSGEAHARLAILSVQRIVQAADELRRARIREREQAALWPEETPEQQLGMLVISKQMTELINITRRVAASTVTVLFTGETGTGKELLARALHEASPRSKKPFVPFNCTAVARDMLESQLFGHRRGAFTGATDAFPGVIRAAAGGTLFLDEIGEMSLDLQPKLLRFLESGEIHPLGEARPLHVDVRLVAATNASLERLVEAGRFREDLFYRLNVVRLQVPPLRDRREEIPPLVHHYLSKYSLEWQKTSLRLAEETMEYLVLYKWPGNVRQLANEVRRLVALAESGAVLMPEHLSPDIAASRRTLPPSERALAPTELVVRIDQPLSAAVEHVERTMIQDALSRTGGRLEEAAHLLGLSRKGLYLKRQRLGLDLDGQPARAALH